MGLELDNFRLYFTLKKFRQVAYPFGTDIFAPSKIACDNGKSNASAATVAARSASQISLRPSNAGAVSQNSSRFERNCPSVSGTSDFQRIGSWQSGWFFRGAPPLTVELAKQHTNEFEIHDTYYRWLSLEVKCPVYLDTHQKCNDVAQFFFCFMENRKYLQYFLYLCNFILFISSQFRIVWLNNLVDGLSI